MSIHAMTRLSRSWGIPLLFVAYWLSTARAQIAPRTEPTPPTGRSMTITETVVADGVYQFTIAEDGYVEQLNSIAIIGERDVLVFDTNTRPSYARQVLQRLRQITPKPVRYVVNSHWHPDHWSGNSVYADAFPGVEIIATAQAYEYMRNAAPPWPARFRAILGRTRADLQKQISTGVKPNNLALTAEERQARERKLDLYKEFVDEAATIRRVYPTSTYVDRMTIRRGEKEIHLVSMLGDAKGTTVLFLPSAGVLLTGDLLVYPIPYGTPSLIELIADLKKLVTFNAKVIVPGHGPAQRDHRFITAEIALLESVLEQVRQALRRGAADLSEVQKAVNVERFRDDFTHGDPRLVDGFQAWVNSLVARAIRDLREQDYS